MTPEHADISKKRPSDGHPSPSICIRHLKNVLPMGIRHLKNVLPMGIRHLKNVLPMGIRLLPMGIRHLPMGTVIPDGPR